MGALPGVTNSTYHARGNNMESLNSKIPIQTNTVTTRASDTGNTIGSENENENIRSNTATSEIG